MRHLVLRFAAVVVASSMLLQHRAPAAEPPLPTWPVPAMIEALQKQSGKRQEEARRRLAEFAADDVKDDAAALLRRGQLHHEAGDYQAAIADYTRALGQSPDLAQAYYLRGRARFCAGKVKPSVADFDRYVELQPDQKPQMWERGIALYYAGRYDDGAAQFALYQTYHDNDVENATWRYLCMARSVGVEKARAELLPIRDDRRVPMMKIYTMFQGNATPDNVLRAARTQDVSREAAGQSLFYAHLYVGLYHEAQGDADAARDHILKARQYQIGHYMWDVANVHASLLTAGKQEPKP